MLLKQISSSLFQNLSYTNPSKSTLIDLKKQYSFSISTFRLSFFAHSYIRIE